MTGIRYPIKGGQVELLDKMGSDLDIVNAARVSTGKKSAEFGDKERRLLRYLWKHKHTSPFEQAVLKFRLRLPIFVMRQLIRYRTARVNELSGRYAEIPEDFYIPLRLHGQDEVNKQKSGTPLSVGTDVRLRSLMDEQSKQAFTLYKKLLKEGVSREQARLILPLNAFTECVWQMDLHNLIKFLFQRLSSDAQDEIRWYAEEICDVVREEFPETWALLQADLPRREENIYSVPENLPTPTRFYQGR